MFYMIGMCIVAILWCVMILLLAIFRWDWLKRYPRLYLDRWGRWMDAEYNPNIRKKTIIKFSAVLVLMCVLMAIVIYNYVGVLKLEDYTEVNAGEALPLAGGELVFRDWVVDDEIAIVRNSAATGQYGNYTVMAYAHSSGEALVAFTGILTNTTGQTLVISREDIKMWGVPTDPGHGYKFKGSWMADHKTDGEGKVELAPGESAFLYFWAVLNKDEKTFPYAYVIQDGENYYRLNLDSLRPAAAGILTALNTYEALQETLGSAEELALGDTCYGENLGYVTLEDIQFKEGNGLLQNRLKPFMELVLDIESAGRLSSAEALEQWMTILVLADDGICWEDAGFSIKEQKEPAKEGDNYSAEVHYEVAVPERVRSYQIIISTGGNTYVVNYEP